MQTRCPHCSTQFRITESQVNTAEGYVRCGVCNEVFNAFEVASDEEQQPSLLDAEVLTTTEVQSELPDPDGITDASLQGANPDTRPDIHPETQPDVLTDNLSDNQTGSVNTAHANATVEKNTARDDFDFFAEDILSSKKSVIPDELRDSTTAIDLNTLLWSAGILLLIATLFLEYAWFNRHQLKQVPEMQGWIDSLCLQIDCSTIAMRDPKNIELVSRNIYTHPDNKDALKVEVTMKNNAEFAQPYPVMQIYFSDIRGSKVAARRFLPSEYLQVETKKLKLIQPDSKLSFTMEIVDPGKQAKTYEFNFL